ncbi:hypothetical protein PC118_g16200 [Phytophthora cactorum]|uniref:Uncharacterized protein n=1 Tax=Phytophthora cactorum TaxID=29920 RepID=A0A8T1FLP2_9STRA|nr:hypothetical protein PC118_g16200 [Phytophthora cactorum]
MAYVRCLGLVAAGMEWRGGLEPPWHKATGGGDLEHITTLATKTVLLVRLLAFTECPVLGLSSRIPPTSSLTGRQINRHGANCVNKYD